MKKRIETLYRNIPEGYLKYYIRSLISFGLHQFSFNTENITIDSISFLAYKVPVYDNAHLALEVSGYNKYYELKRRDTVIDVGGYSGFFTIYAAKKVGEKGKVITFEPDPFNYKLLLRNLALNHINNTVILHKGLYSRETTLPFDIQGIGSSLVIGENRKVLHKVPVVSLDNELKRLGIKNVDFIKMDIEGGEIEAVKGCLETIKNNKNIHLAIASYHIVNGKQTSTFLEPYFKKLGLQVKTDKTIHPTTYISKNL